MIILVIVLVGIGFGYYKLRKLFQEEEPQMTIYNESVWESMITGEPLGEVYKRRLMNYGILKIGEIEYVVESEYVAPTKIVKHSATKLKPKVVRNNFRKMNPSRRKV